jgi:hypothetical protein
VIENYHALGAGYPLQQALDLRVVDRLDLVGIVEIPNDSTWDGLWSVEDKERRGGVPLARPS